MEITALEILFCKKIHKDIDDTQSLAEKINVNKSLLYDVEAGRRSMSISLFNKITKYYGITYDHDESLYDEAYDTLIKLFQLYISYQIDELYKLYDSYKAKQAIYENSKAFIFVDLINAIYYLKKYEYDEVKHCINNCKDYLEIYDNNIIYLYTIVWIVTKKMYQDLVEIKAFLMPIYKKYSFADIDPYIKAMLYFQIGRITELGGNEIEALPYFDKSMNCYYKLNIHQRVVQNEIQKATCYFTLKQYSLAEKTYLEAYEESLKHNYKFRLIPCCNNLAFLYFVQQDYDNTLKFIEQARKYGSTFPDLNYYEAYIIYQRESKLIARRKIKKLIETENDVRIIHTLKFIQAMLNENDKNIEKYFAYCLEDNQKINAQLDLELIYKMAISYYKLHDKNRAYELMETIL
ncbi:MAG: helix-turn-helix transcriptional regulator [Erysipelotrichaceae bacterium]|nr:helix-turn-helix transcriptional regulator [Erysipelotrichaceae bacterium]